MKKPSFILFKNLIFVQNDGNMETSKIGEIRATKVCRTNYSNFLQGQGLKKDFQACRLH